MIYVEPSVSTIIFFLIQDAASKHACQAFFDCLRSEVAKHGIYVTVISPGYIHTNLSKNAMTGDGSKHGGKLRVKS